MSPIYVYWLCKCQPLLKILRIFLRKILGTRCGLVRKFANVLRTFGVGVVEVQLLDLSGPRHGRQHFEGMLPVDPAAAVDVELEEGSECFEILELACGFIAVGREA